MQSDQDVAKVLEEIVKNHDDLFPTFSEEMAEKIRKELIEAYKQKQEYDRMEKRRLPNVY